MKIIILLVAILNIASAINIDGNQNLLYHLTVLNQNLKNLHQIMKDEYVPLSLDIEDNLLKHISLLEFDAGITCKMNACSDNKNLQLIRKLYDQNRLGITYSTNNLKIPKIIHQIWLGGPVPAKFMPWMESWKKFHPGWIYILWTDADLEKFELYNKALFDRSVNFGQKSDILRYEILFLYGGLYVDIDFKCLKPFDMLHYTYDFYSGMFCTTITLPNGLIGTRPNHPIIKCAIESMKISKQNDFKNIMHNTGPYHFTNCFMKIAPQLTDETIIVFPHTVFFPAQAKMRHLPYEVQDEFIKPESFAIHYWSCSWQKK